MVGDDMQVTLFSRIRFHAPRLLSTLGRSLVLGSSRFRLRGYHADGFTPDLLDEPHLVPVISRLLRTRGGAFVDVGANCGQTLAKVLAADPHRQYVGFEPQVECCFFIESFIRTNRIKTATVLPLALAKENGLAKLAWNYPRDPTAAILTEDSEPQQRETSQFSWVAARRGDDVMRELGISDVAAIKIDVEGFELEVLEGFAETLADSKSALLFEVLTNHVWGELIGDSAQRTARQDRANKIYEFLRALGYVVFRLDGQGNEHRIERFDLDTRPQHPFINDGRDYLALHEG